MVNEKDIMEHPRNEKIEFDKKNHTYTYCDDRNFKGSTSWISQYTKPFNKKEIANKLAKQRGVPASQIIAKWDAARDYGDYVHENVETYVNNGLEFKTPELKLFKKNIKKLGLTPVKAEWVIYDEDIERASAIDVTCLNENEKIVLIDIKTREKEITKTGYKGQMMKGVLSDVPDSYYHKYCLQVNIYKDWVTRKYNKEVAPTNYIFQLRDDFCNVIPVIDMEDKIKKMYNDIQN